jgi:hypothetical protein
VIVLFVLSTVALLCAAGFMVLALADTFAWVAGPLSRLRP